MDTPPVELLSQIFHYYAFSYLEDIKKHVIDESDKARKKCLYESKQQKNGDKLEKIEFGYLGECMPLAGNIFVFPVHFAPIFRLSTVCKLWAIAFRTKIFFEGFGFGALEEKLLCCARIFWIPPTMFKFYYDIENKFSMFKLASKVYHDTKQNDGLKKISIRSLWNYHSSVLSFTLLARVLESACKYDRKYTPHTVYRWSCIDILSNHYNLSAPAYGNDIENVYKKFNGPINLPVTLINKTRDWNNYVCFDALNVFGPKANRLDPRARLSFDYYLTLLLQTTIPDTVTYICRNIFSYNDYGMGMNTAEWSLGKWETFYGELYKYACVNDVKLPYERLYPWLPFINTVRPTTLMDVSFTSNELWQKYMKVCLGRLPYQKKIISDFENTDVYKTIENRRLFIENSIKNLLCIGGISALERHITVFNYIFICAFRTAFNTVGRITYNRFEKRDEFKKTWFESARPYYSIGFSWFRELVYNLTKTSKSVDKKYNIASKKTFELLENYIDTNFANECLYIDGDTVHQNVILRYHSQTHYTKLVTKILTLELTSSLWDGYCNSIIPVLLSYYTCNSNDIDKLPLYKQANRKVQDILSQFQDDTYHVLYQTIRLMTPICLCHQHPGRPHSQERAVTCSLHYISSGLHTDKITNMFKKRYGYYISDMLGDFLMYPQLIKPCSYFDGNKWIISNRRAPLPPALSCDMNLDIFRKRKDDIIFISTNPELFYCSDYNCDYFNLIKYSANGAICRPACPCECGLVLLNNDQHNKHAISRMNAPWHFHGIVTSEILPDEYDYTTTETDSEDTTDCLNDMDDAYNEENTEEFDDMTF
jgi:hypothetical protein